MQILDVQPIDTDTLGALMRHVVTTSLSLDKDEIADVLANIQSNLHWAQAHADSATHLKCVDGSKIVGVVLIKHFWNLCSLFVDPSYQHQGVGRALLSEAMRRCIGKNDDKRYIKVNSAPTAVQFYQSLGFQTNESAARKGTSVPMIRHLGA
jgi:GNAT superfamily N-acetyltransferase